MKYKKNFNLKEKILRSNNKKSLKLSIKMKKQFINGLLLNFDKKYPNFTEIREKN